MTLQVIQCKESDIDGFCHYLLEKGYAISSLESVKLKRKKNVVVGKITKIFDVSTELDFTLILFTEYLPSREYKESCKAAIHNDLSRELIKSQLGVGDSIAFFEPFVFENPVFRTNYNLFEPKYALDFGIKENSLILCAKKQNGTIDKKDRTISFTATLQDKQDQPKNCTEIESHLDKETHSSVGQNLKNITTHNPCDAVNEQQASCSRNNNQKTRPKHHKDNTSVNPLTKTKESGARQNCGPSTSGFGGGNQTMKTITTHYPYKTVARTKADAISGDLSRVNLFGVAYQVIKPLGKTGTGKHTVIWSLVDESTDCPPEYFTLHFFTKEDTILKQIQQGDVLRLHRVQVEIFQDSPDGRIFNSTDITLFKKNSNEITSVAKNSRITDQDKNRVQELKKWYKNILIPHLSSTTVTLSSIRESGCYSLLCLLVKDPVVTDNIVLLEVTDGTTTEHFEHSKCINNAQKIATDIIVKARINVLSKLKGGDCVLIVNVKAVKEDTLSLVIDSFVNFFNMEKDINEVKELNRRLDEANKCHSPEVRQTDSQLKNPETKRNADTNADATEGATKVPQSKQVNKNNMRENIVELEQNNDILIGNAKSQPIREAPETANTKPISEESFRQLRNRPHSTCIKPPTSKQKKNKTSERLGKTGFNAGRKARKALFTANNGDWTEADMDESEESQSGSEEENTDVEVKTLMNISMDTLAEIVRTKYCSPRRVAATGPNIELQGHKNFEDNMQPVVSLRKLSDDKYNCDKNEVENKTDDQKSQSKNVPDKRKNSVADSDEASTVVNISCQRQLKSTHGQRKRPRLETHSPAGKENDLILGVAETNPRAKVTSWLLNTPIPGKDSDPEDLDWTTTKAVLGINEAPTDLSSGLSFVEKRFRGFLLDVIPNLDGLPEDLVSGYCTSGCRNMYLYSVIHWEEGERSSLPLCPACIKLEQERELELTFMFQLVVLDSEGSVDKILVCRQHGETFLNCTARDFLRDPEMARSRVQLLKDCCIRKGVTSVPVMDLIVGCVNSILCLVNTRLKFPSTL